MSININSFCNISKLNTFLKLFCLQKCLFNLLVTFFFSKMLVSSGKKYNLTCYTLAKKKKKSWLGFYPGRHLFAKTNNSTTLMMCQTSYFNRSAWF